MRVVPRTVLALAILAIVLLGSVPADATNALRHLKRQRRDENQLVLEDLIRDSTTAEPGLSHTASNPGTNAPPKGALYQKTGAAAQQATKGQHETTKGQQHDTKAQQQHAGGSTASHSSSASASASSTQTKITKMTITPQPLITPVYSDAVPNTPQEVVVTNRPRVFTANDAHHVNPVVEEAVAAAAPVATSTVPATTTVSVAAPSPVVEAEVKALPTAADKAAATIVSSSGSALQGVLDAYKRGLSAAEAQLTGSETSQIIATAKQEAVAVVNNCGTSCDNKVEAEEVKSECGSSPCAAPQATVTTTTCTSLDGCPVVVTAITSCGGSPCAQESTESSEASVAKPVEQLILEKLQHVEAKLAALNPKAAESSSIHESAAHESAAKAEESSHESAESSDLPHAVESSSHESAASELSSNSLARIASQIKRDTLQEAENIAVQLVEKVTEKIEEQRGLEASEASLIAHEFTAAAKRAVDAEQSEESSKAESGAAVSTTESSEDALADTLFRRVEGRLLAEVTKIAERVARHALAEHGMELSDEGEATTESSRAESSHESVAAAAKKAVAQSEVAAKGVLKEALGFEAPIAGHELTESDIDRIMHNDPTRKELKKVLQEAKEATRFRELGLSLNEDEDNEGW